MNHRIDAGFQERHDVAALLFAGGQDAPEPFLPAVAPVASRALRHLAVDHHFANRLFAGVVRWCDVVLDESKIIVLPLRQTLRNIFRVLVVRHAALRGFQDVAAMFVHPSLPCEFRDIAVIVDRREHTANVSQQSLAVIRNFFVFAFGEKFDFANEMCPTKLQHDRSQTLEFAIRSPKIARDDAGVIRAEKLFEHDAATRRIDVKHRKFLRPHTPSPTSLAVFLVAGFVDVKMRFTRQLRDEFGVRFRHCIACLANLFGKKASRNLERHGIGEEVAHRCVGHVSATFEPRGQRDELRSEEAGFFDFRRQVGAVITLTMLAPRPCLLKFGHDERFLDELDLLMNFRRLVGGLEFSAARRTGIELEFDGLVDLRRVEGLAKILLVTFLTAGLAFLAVATTLTFRLGVLRWLDNIGRRRLRRVAGMLLKRGNGRVKHNNFGFELGNPSTKLFDQGRLLQNKLLQIHKPCFTPLNSVQQYQFHCFYHLTP